MGETAWNKGNNGSQCRSEMRWLDNPGGPTAAINATLSGVIRGVLQHASHVKTLYGTRNGIEGVLRGELIDLTARFFHDPDALALLEQTPAAALGSCRKKLPDSSCQAEEYQKIFSVFEQYHIRYFFYIGGNDSMDTVAKLNLYAARHLDIPSV